jgi:hypothetical protein
MIIHLSEEQFEFLIAKLPEELEAVIPNIQIIKREKEVVIDVEKTTAEDIRIWAIDELQRAGYDKMYNLNVAGAILLALKERFSAE